MCDCAWKIKGEQLCKDMSLFSRIRKQHNIFIFLSDETVTCGIELMESKLTRFDCVTLSISCSRNLLIVCRRLSRRRISGNDGPFHGV
jgi:hypothetical protein